MGLNQIITVSLPLLLFVYPIAITVVMLIIVNKFVRLSRPGMRLCVAVAGICAVIDILHQFAGVALAGTIMEGLPLGTSGLGWMVPVCICLLLSLVLPQKITGQVDVVEETK